MQVKTQNESSEADLAWEYDVELTPRFSDKPGKVEIEFISVEPSTEFREPGNDVRSIISDSLDDPPKELMQDLDVPQQSIIGQWLPKSWSQVELFDGNVDEEGSVLSVPYFDAVDFNTNHWRKVVHTPATMGLAVIGLAFAFSHPIMFTVGILTTWGTIAVASKGYDCVKTGGSSCCLDWRTLIGEEQEKKDNAAVQEHQPLPPVPDPDLNNIPAETPIKVHKSKEDGLVDDLTESSVSSNDDEHCADAPLNVAVSHVSLPENWMDTHFTPLKHEVVVNEEFVGLNVEEFFQVFFADKAPYHFKEFQKNRGDLGICYKNWEPAPVCGSLSLHPPIGAPAFDFDVYHSLQQRLVTFRAKTNSSAFLGPPYATTAKTQRFFMLSKRLAVFEHRTELSDIPFSNTFCVLERWVLKATKDKTGRYSTFVSVQADVVFTSSCPFESMIRKKSQQTVSDVVHAWCIMAKEALVLTEKAKQARLLREANSSESGIQSCRHDSIDAEEFGIEQIYEGSDSDLQSRSPALNESAARRQPLIKRTISRVMSLTRGTNAS